MGDSRNHLDVGLSGKKKKATRPTTTVALPHSIMPLFTRMTMMQLLEKSWKIFASNYHCHALMPTAPSMYPKLYMIKLLAMIASSSVMKMLENQMTCSERRYSVLINRNMQGYTAASNAPSRIRAPSSCGNVLHSAVLPSTMPRPIKTRPRYFDISKRCIAREVGI